jgi:hypothetical protein
MRPEAEGELDSLLAELRAMLAQIEEIRALSAGPLLNESSLDAALCVDLEDAEALERYRVHPVHQPVAGRLREVAAEVVVADYEL